MKKISTHFMAMALCGALCIIGLTTGCAKKDIAQLGERMRFLERDVLDTRAESVTTTEELKNLELRVDYLEREAVARGVKVPPRIPVSPASPAATKPDNTSQLLSKLPPSPMPSSPAVPSLAAPSADTKPVPAKLQSKPSKTTPAKTKTADNAAAQPDTNAIGSASSPAALPAELPGSLPVVSGEASASASIPDSIPGSTPISTGTIPRVSESSPTTPTPPSAPPSAPVQTEKNAYNAALHLYRTGRFPESEAAFQAFLEVYPNSSLVANALYWKGETFYSRGRFADAIFSFKDVQTRFPKHAKTPDSLLKTAMAYGKLGDKANESLHLTVLFEDWPQAEAAKRAHSMGLKP